MTTASLQSKWIDAFLRAATGLRSVECVVPPPWLQSSLLSRPAFFFSIVWSHCLKGTFLWMLS